MRHARGLLKPTRWLPGGTASRGPAELEGAPGLLPSLPMTQRRRKGWLAAPTGTAIKPPPPAPHESECGRWSARTRGHAEGGSPAKPLRKELAWATVRGRTNPVPGSRSRGTPIGRYVISCNSPLGPSSPKRPPRASRRPRRTKTGASSSRRPPRWGGRRTAGCRCRWPVPLDPITYLERANLGKVGLFATPACARRLRVATGRGAGCSRGTRRLRCPHRCRDCGGTGRRPPPAAAARDRGHRRRWHEYLVPVVCHREKARRRKP